MWILGVLFRALGSVCLVKQAIDDLAYLQQQLVIVSRRSSVAEENIECKLELPATARAGDSNPLTLNRP
jgi:hypothetical protein